MPCNTIFMHMSKFWFLWIESYTWKFGCLNLVHPSWSQTWKLQFFEITILPTSLPNLTINSIWLCTKKTLPVFVFDFFGLLQVLTLTKSWLEKPTYYRGHSIPRQVHKLKSWWNCWKVKCPFVSKEIFKKKN